MENEFYGYKKKDFVFMDRDAIIVFPENVSFNKKWMLKTEYFGAFPELELAMLKEGYALAYLKNRNRWGTDEDQIAKRDFAEYLNSEYGFKRRCICIGMSCGGFHAVNFASRFPSYVSLLYLDAPLLSFCGWSGNGAGNREVWEKEQMEAYGFKTTAEIRIYNDQPVHRLKTLTDNNIPVALVYGDADTCVSPEENALVLYQYYIIKNAPIKIWRKRGCDHHPHVAVDTDEVMEFIKRNEL